MRIISEYYFSEPLTQTAYIAESAGQYNGANGIITSWAKQ